MTTEGTPYVGGRILLEAGDVVEIHEKNVDGEIVAVRRARVKHTRMRPGHDSMWQTPLAIFPDTPLPELVDAPAEDDAHLDAFLNHSAPQGSLHRMGENP